MFRRLNPVMPVLLGVFFAQIALGILSPLIGLILTQRGIPASLIGLVASAYFLGFLAGAQLCDRIVVRVGHIRAFTVFAALGADAVLLQVVTDSPYAWAALRAVTGFAMSGLFLVAESWLNDKSDASTRGQVFGAYLFISWAASAVGPQALHFAHDGSHDLFVATAIAFSTALIPMALTNVGNPVIAPRARYSVARLFRVSPLGVIACLGSGLVNSAFYGMAPVYIERTGMSAGFLSIMLTTALVGGLVVQYPIGIISDKLGRRPVTLVTLIVALVFSIAMMLVGGHSINAFLVCAFIFSGAVAPLYGLGAGQTNDHIDRSEFVGASGGLLFAWALGASAGPTLAGVSMSLLGAPGLFVYLAVILAAVAGFTAYRMRRRASVPLDEQSTFVPASQTPTRVAEFDPRSATGRSTTRRGRRDDDGEHPSAEPAPFGVD